MKNIFQLMDGRAMGAIGGLLGTAGGASGSGFAAPEKADIASPVNQGQIDNANSQAQYLANISQNFAQNANQVNGFGNLQSAYNQLQGVANGTGPNPALAQLNQATAANTANQAALMAGQRGSAQNAGLIARQAAMQGGANQQNAAGQAATLQAQQSLGALNSLGSLAGTQVGAQQNAINSANSAAQGNQGALLNAQSSYNNAQVNNQAGVNTANAGLASQTMGNQAKLLGGGLGGLGTAVGLAAGGVVSDTANATGPSSAFGQFLKGMNATMAAAGGNQQQDPLEAGANKLAQGIASRFKSTPQTTAVAGGPMDAGQVEAPGTMLAAKGGAVKAMLSPGEKYLPPQAVEQVKQGADPMKIGKEVPGKPKVKGAKNSYANDTIPATLEEGGIVLPRSVTQSKNPQWAAHKFVSQVMAKQGKLK